MRKYYPAFSKAMVVLVLITLPFTGLAGCAREVREERVVSNPGTVGSTTTTVIERETVVEEDSSVFGTIFNFIGEVIALPFRLVAGVFQAIF